MRPEDEGVEAGRPPRGDDAGARTAGGPTAEPWLLAALLCLLGAVVCLWFALFDAAFVVAALGAVAWFLNVRAKLPRRDEEEETEDADEE